MKIPVIFLSIFYILYGLFKVIIGYCVFYVPPENIDKIPIVNYFSIASNDKTLAGQFYDYTLLIFGIYIILSGFALLNVFPTHINNLFDMSYVKYNIYNIYNLFGIIILIFYILVLHIDLPISKNLDDNKLQYEIFGYGGSLFFFIVPIFWYAMSFISTLYKNLSKDIKTIIIIGTIIILSIAYEIIYKYLYNTYNKYKVKRVNTTTTTIPLPLPLSSPLYSHLYSPLSLPLPLY